ncbi:MAG: hypothetical protein ACRDTJ_08495 [Pseudonocardiaceae bacterium]
MALPNLATTTDLSARGFDVTSNPAVTSTMLAVASSLVREAAGSPIAQHTATISFYATERGQYLALPTRPVTVVGAVLLDGVAATDYKLVDGSLWRREGWYTCEPVEAQVTLTCGLPEVPPSIVQLVCDLAILGINSSTSGALDPRVIAERIDDYSVTFAPGAEAVSSAMTIPPATRLALRARFGGGVGSVRMR